MKTIVILWTMSEVNMVDDARAASLGFVRPILREGVSRSNLLQSLGLATMAAVKSFRGELIKSHKGRRDIQRITRIDDAGHEQAFYLKRTWKPYKKDGLASLVRHGRVRSISRQECENSLALAAAGLGTPGLIAYGEECGLLWEKFSFILMEAATGTQTVAQFVQSCNDPARRRRVFDALASEIRRMHDAGLASPDLFTRHLFVEFVDESASAPRFCFIDMARLDHRKIMPEKLRARDLAALNITAPLRFVTVKERIRFLRMYCRGTCKKLFPRIRKRFEHLRERRKFRDFGSEDGAGIIPEKFPIA